MNQIHHTMNSSLTFLLTALFILTIPRNASAQTNLADLTPAQYFDFWIGEWQLTWQDADGTTGTGTNTVERILDGRVIKENFKGLTGAFSGFTGESYSVYNPRTDIWKQTWVDNSGGYLDFTGHFRENKRLFIREGVNQNQEPVLQQMIFYDIDQDSFTWDWQISPDNGETWTLQWRIHYRRAN